MSELGTLAFWETEVRCDAPAVFYNGELVLRYEKLICDIEKWRCRLGDQPRSLILFRISNHPMVVAPLLAALAERHVVMLVDATLPTLAFEALVEAYRPAAIFESCEAGYTIRLTEFLPYPIDEQLCLLLSTSGSTGSAKFVRLSHSAVRHNALAIASSLCITNEDIAVAHLDVHYSYGWSVFASHLVVGASLAFSSSAFTERAFWQSIRDSEATHFPGVPAHYEIMNRLQFRRLNVPSVSTMTQAGGRLSNKVRDVVHAHMDSVGKRFIVMYGQTEAGPRMSLLGHEEYALHADSVGRALPDGHFHIVDPTGLSIGTGEPGQIIYRGPNVMLGYAQGWADLSSGDVLNGSLATGDQGRLDDDGFLSIDGRLSREGKIFGLRVNLDEVEAHMSALGRFSVCQKDEKIAIIRATTDGTVRPMGDTERNALISHLNSRFTVPMAAWRFYVISEIPLNERNKTDYSVLGRLIDESC